MQKRVAIYARYSSAGQREESIEDQVRVCTEAAERDGHVVVTVYQDRAVTGTSTEHRDGFMRMIADAPRDMFDLVYVYKTDRFARNRYDSAVYKAKLKKAGVPVVSATEGIADGPDGILLESLLEGMAEYYSANLSQNVKRGVHGNALKCKHNGVRCFGYDLGEDKYYHVNECEADAVRRIFGMYLDGMGFPEICEELPHVRTKMGCPLSMQMIGKILRNEKYAGVYRYGGVCDEQGMPAIVSVEDFDRVQKRLALRMRRRKDTVDYLLTGRLFDVDGHRYQSSSGHGKSGKKYTYYRCPATGHQVPQAVMEDVVAEAVAALLSADDEAVSMLVGLIMDAQESAVADDVAAMDAMRKRLSQNDREQSRMVDLAAKTGAIDAVAAKMAELADEKAALECDLSEMDRGCPVFDAGEVEFWLRHIMGEQDPLEAVRLFVRTVWIDRENHELSVEFFFDERAKNDPRQNVPGEGSRKYPVAESWGFEPQTPFWGVLA